MKYYYGSDKFSCAAALNLIENNPVEHWNSSYTGTIGKMLKIEEIKKEFPPIAKDLRQKMIYEAPQGGIIISKQEEFSNVYCYDVVSAYLANLLEGKLPCGFKKVNKVEKGKCHFGKITVKGLKAKNNKALSLYRGKRIPEDCIINGKRIVAALEYSFYCYLELELPILNYFYTFESIEISDIYQIEMKELPTAAKDAIKELYDKKKAAKGSLEYDGYKQMLNRIFGYFITCIGDKDNLRARDYQVPYQIGIWLISKQRYVMWQLIQKVGIEHIVSAHTDGVKVDYNANDIVDVINLRRGSIYRDMGQWDKEAVLEKVQYFSNVKAKYIENGVLKMKHGGICEEDIKAFLQDKTYDDINGNTKFLFTIYKEINSNKDGTFIIHKKVETCFSEIGGEANDMV